MIQLCRADERRHSERRQQEVWFTFHPQHQTGQLADGFGSLSFLSEYRLRPGASVAPHPRNESEIVSYVREGSFECSKSSAPSTVTHAGDFLRMPLGHGTLYSEANPSRSHSAHVFQLGLQPSKEGTARAAEHKHFTTAQRRNVLCVVASLDGRKGSLGVGQDILIFSSILERGHHFAYDLPLGRSAWLHIVQGEGALGEIDLITGDGVGITAERAVSFTAHEDTEILLVDVGEIGPERSLARTSLDRIKAN